MTNTTKMTNSQALAIAIDSLVNGGFDNAEVIEKLTNIKASIDKKNNGDSKKALARKAENKALADKVLEFLGSDSKTVSEILAEGGFEYTNQKMTSVLSRDDRFKSEKIKGKSYYSVA